MPPTPIPAGYGIAAHVYALGATGQEMLFTHGFENVLDRAPDTNAADIADAWLAFFTAGVTLSSYTYRGCRVVQNDAGVRRNGEAPRAVAGTVVAPAVSPAVSVCVTKRTGIVGTKFRGRMYLPPVVLPEDQVSDSGVILGPTLTGLQARIDNYLNSLNSGAEVPVVLLHADLSAPTLVTSMLVRSTVRTQRRRQLLG